ncbi:MAG: hypothetical protein AAB833_01795 [Patescibacteria group bacterium]
MYHKLSERSIIRTSLKTIGGDTAGFEVIPEACYYRRTKYEQ